MAKNNRSSLGGAQERARKALVHANNMRERAKRALRVAALDGRLEVDSQDGRGTTVRAVIPN